jgi:hypothetical protein
MVLINYIDRVQVYNNIIFIKELLLKFKNCCEAEVRVRIIVEDAILHLVSLS